MPGFNRPDFPEVPDNKIHIGDHRDGMPLRVTDLYQEIGSLSNEPVLHDQILTPSIVPETMEQKIANAINDFLSTGLKKSKKQTVIEKFAAFLKDGEDAKTALDAFSTKPKTPKEAAGMVEGRRKFEEAAAKITPPKQVMSKERQLTKAISLYLKDDDEEVMELCKCGRKRGHKQIDAIDKDAQYAQVGSSMGSSESAAFGCG